ncbi:hypothetical protein ACFLZN_02725 [Nanoarchaeota archaeon]
MKVLDAIANHLKQNVKLRKNIPQERFVRIESKPGKIAFVDGGSGIIHSAPEYCLALLRIYYCIYESNKRIDSRKEEFFVYLSAENNAELSCKFFGKEHEIIKLQLEEKMPQDYVDVIRKTFELKLAQDIGLNSGDCLILDGDLEAEEQLEQNEFNKLKAKCKDKGVLLGALSKTNRFITDKGTAVISDLHKVAPKGVWYYNHKENVYFTKLHASSKYIFRLDTENPDITGLLIPQSNDAAFLGYPYGLLEADARARVTFKEVERLRLLLSMKVKNDSLKALDAHSVLDRINKD